MRSSTYDRVARVWPVSNGATVSDEPDVGEKLGGPLGEAQQGVPLTGEALADYWAKEEARLGHPPQVGPTPAQKRSIEADIKKAKKAAGL
jgi:hypothetical protein